MTRYRLLAARVCTGHTLLEMTIAVALGLVVVAGTVATYRSQRAAFGYAADAARIRDAGINALVLIGDQIQMAGFVPAGSSWDSSAPPLFGCSAGRANVTQDSVTCTSLSSRSDGIALGYVADGQSTWLSTAGEVTDCLGQGVGLPGTVVVNAFHAKPSTSSAESELYCEGSGHAGTAQPLIEGVERLRLRYWLDGAAQSADASELRSDQWADVAAVDLCVLVRGAVSARAVRYVDCDGASVASEDGRSRQAFWRHIAIRNHRGAAL
ncbi:MAG TPA: PilW family protein [Paraburkholderia sp.]